MKKFYCLDLDVSPVADFADYAVEVSARSASDAAKDMARLEDGTDGVKASIMVSETPDPADARVFTVMQRIRIEYVVEEDK